MKKIVVFPKSDNPYQDLLYSQQSFVHDDITYLELHHQSTVVMTFFAFTEMIRLRLKGYTVFHLHWWYPFTRHYGNSIITNFYRFYIFWILLVWLLFIRLLGFKIIYTVHNIVPHETLTFNDQLFIRLAYLLFTTSILHSTQTLEDLHTLSITPNKFFIIPVGTYQSLYEATETRHDFRRKYAIPLSAFVYLFFGTIRDYKGIDTLISAFTQITDTTVRLLVAGECRDSALYETLLALAKTDERIILHMKLIPDEEVANYFQACDVAVFPFKKVTTSSSVILAFSQKKTAILPRLGNLKDIPESCAYFYDASDINALIQGITSVITASDIQERADQAFAYSQTFSWEDIATRTRELY